MAEWDGDRGYCALCWLHREIDTRAREEDVRCAVCGGQEIDQVDVTPDGETVLGYCAACWQKKGLEEARPIQV